jgi:hypothetical protein
MARESLCKGAGCWKYDRQASCRWTRLSIIKHFGPILVRYRRQACQHPFTPHSSYVKVPLLALQGRAAFRRIRHHVVVYAQARELKVYPIFTCVPCSGNVVPTCVSHLAVVLPRCLSGSPRPRTLHRTHSPRGTESWRGAPSLTVVDVAP